MAKSINRYFHFLASSKEAKLGQIVVSVGGYLSHVRRLDR
jgi:hypothetical protein